MKVERNERGITLVALVVTIIVLLILAGVTIAMVLGQNGIFRKTQVAVENTNSSQELEQVELAVLEAKTNSYLDGTNLKTELESSIHKTYKEADVTESGEYYVIGNMASGKTYLVDEKGKVTEAEEVELPEGLGIGSEVTYNPSGSYKWEAEYCSSDKADTDDVLLESGEGKSFGLAKWKVIDINKITGQVTLVPSTPTIGTVYLGQAQGYNNGVYLLNEACSKLYGNEAKGIKARSMNIEDIEGKMKPEKLEELHQQVIAGVKYGEQIPNAYTTNKSYPSIYEQEKLSVINGIKKETGLDLSQQEELIGRNDNGATNGKGYKEAKDSIQPYMKYWYIDKTLLPTVFKDNFYNLMILNGDYWLASRCVPTSSTGGRFVLRYVTDGDLRAQKMFGSDSLVSDKSKSLLPVVSLPASLIEKDASSGFTVKV